MVWGSRRMSGLKLDLQFGDPLMGDLAVLAVAQPYGIPAGPEVGEDVITPQSYVGVHKPGEAEGAGAQLHRAR